MIAVLTLLVNKWHPAICGISLRREMKKEKPSVLQISAEDGLK